MSGFSYVYHIIFAYRENCNQYKICAQAKSKILAHTKYWLQMPLGVNSKLKSSLSSSAFGLSPKGASIHPKFSGSCVKSSFIT